MSANVGSRKRAGTTVPQSEQQAYEYFCNVQQFRRFLLEEEKTDEGGAWVVTETASRQPKPRTTEDSFFAETLSTSRTIPHLLTVYWSPSSPPSESPKPGWPTITEIRVMAAVGDGVNGYPHISHGGFLATLLDELPGVLVMLNTAHFTPFTSPQPSQQPSATSQAETAAASASPSATNTLPHNQNIRIIPPTTDMLTASLKVQYLRSVHTPCDLLVSVRIVDVVAASSTSKASPQTAASGGGAKPKREKLVYTIHTAASNGVEGKGEVVYARGEAVWVGVPRLDRGGMQRGGGAEKVKL